MSGPRTFRLIQFCENDTDRASGVLPVRNDPGNPSLSRSALRIASWARRRRSSSTWAGSLIVGPNGKLRTRARGTFLASTWNLRDTSHSQGSDDCIRIHSVGHLVQPFSVICANVTEDLIIPCASTRCSGEGNLTTFTWDAHGYTCWLEHTPDIDSISEDFPTDWEPRTQIWGRLMSRETLREIWK